VVVDRDGFEAFYRERYARVVRACTLVLLDSAAAEDVAAESFARLWAHWGTIHDDDHAGGYVFTTAMRLCSKRRSRGTREVVSDISDRASGTDEASRALMRDEVFAALGRLSVRQRQAVVLRDWAGFETEEIAQMLGMKASTVRVHLARGRETLRSMLTVKEEER
jgi:RNA polymerase sigma factor (sigma-70 family)